MKPFEWADATSVEDAIQLTVKGAAIKAGGMDIVDMMKEHLVAPTRDQAIILERVTPSAPIDRPPAS